MWNPVRLVAKNRFLPEQELIVFAVVNEDKYRIDTACDGTVTDPWVGNFWVDQLINDFAAAYPQLCEHARADAIRQLTKGA